MLTESQNFGITEFRTYWKQYTPLKLCFDGGINMGFLGYQGQVTSNWEVWTGWNSSKNLWLSWLPASLMMIRSKLNALSIGQGQIWAYSALKGK